MKDMSVACHNFKIICYYANFLFSRLSLPLRLWSISIYDTSANCRKIEKELGLFHSTKGYLSGETARPRFITAIEIETFQYTRTVHVRRT